MTPMPAVIDARAARLALAGETVIAELTLQTAGSRILLAGDCGALFAAFIGAVPCAGEPANPAAVTGGSLRLLGKDVARREHFELAGMALCDPPLPPSWSVHEYLFWAARVAGAGGRQAKQWTQQALERVAIAKHSGRRLKSLNLAERRVLAVAQAIVTDPRVLLLDRPTAGLDEPLAAAVMQAVERAAADRALVLGVAEAGFARRSSDFVRSCSDVCVLREGRLIFHGPPAQVLGASRLLELTVQSNTEALGAALAERGLELQGGPRHFTVAVPAGLSATDVLAAAAQAKAAVISCVPLFG